jgi:hypothetical protein
MRELERETLPAPLSDALRGAHLAIIGRGRTVEHAAAQMGEVTL